jgi:hypothetical protein
MPFWFPAIAAASAAALIGKIIQRHLNGQLAQSALEDPEGIRTVARFVEPHQHELLSALAADLAGPLGTPLEVTRDAIRTLAGIDVVRLAPSGEACSLALTRAFTGPQLDARAIELLGRLHHALVRRGVRELAWYARQDRELARAHAHPFY